MHLEYKPKGVCSSLIKIDTDGEVIEKIEFVNGCAGNTAGIARLSQGMTVDQVIAKLDGVTCGSKATSCPDQLAQALRSLKLAADE